MKTRDNPATTREEQPVHFPAAQDALFGILTSPTSGPTGTWVVLLPGGSGTLDSINRNRLWVRIARLLGSIGCHAFRFDYHGAGESTGVAGPLRLDRPFTDDLEGAVSCIRDRGAESIVLLGSCFGARTALAGASSVSELRGVILIAPYIRDLTHGQRVAEGMAADWTIGRYMRRLLRVKTFRGFMDPQRRRVYSTVLMAKLPAFRDGKWKRSRDAHRDSPLFLDPFEGLVDRRIPILLIFGDHDDATFLEFEQAKTGRLGDVLQRAGDLVEVSILPGKVHGLRTIRAQDDVVEEVTEWLSRQGLARID